MKLNYIDLINWFWKCDEVWEFTPIETRLYFYLLKVGNMLSWEQNPFWHSDQKTSVGARGSINSMKTARNRLVQAELISIEKGGKGYGNKTRYQILIPKIQPKAQPNPIPNPQPNDDPNPIPKPEPINKLKEKKLLPLSPNGDIPPEGETTPPDDKEKKLEVRKKEFYESLVPFVETYSKEMIRAFFNYWSEANKRKNKMRFEFQKTWETARRLNTWSNNDKSKNDKEFKHGNYRSTDKTKSSDFD